MSAFTLSRDEVRELCRSPIRARQAAFLRANGIRHYIDAHGWPVVLRSTLEGGQSASSAAGWKPRKAG